MSTMMKHVGKVKATDRRCVVVMMQLPENPSLSLIIDVESLTPRYEQIIRELVESQEGQAATDFAHFMTQRSVPETGRNILNEFHSNALMRTEPVDNIIMVPFPNQPIPLVDILEAKGTLPSGIREKEAIQQENVNAVVQNLQAMREEERLSMAHNKLFEADLIEQEAHLKREEAYRIAPELRPRVAKQQIPVGKTAVEAAEAVIDQAPVRGRGRPKKAAE
jgi:hypothetical protein